MRRALVGIAALVLTGCGAASTQSAVIQTASTPNPWAANCDSQQQAALDYYNLVVAQGQLFSEATLTSSTPSPTESLEWASNYRSAASTYLSALPPEGGGPTALVMDNTFLRVDMTEIEDDFVANYGDTAATNEDVALLQSYDQQETDTMSYALDNSGSCQELASTS